MGTNRVRRSTIILLSLLLAGLYLATVTVEPVFAANATLKPKTYDKGIKIDKIDNDKKVKNSYNCNKDKKLKKEKKDNDDNSIIITSHPVLKR